MSGVWTVSAAARRQHVHALETLGFISKRCPDCGVTWIVTRLAPVAVLTTDTCALCAKGVTQ
jgi:hypothetical protein